ncbi:IclR family transcriptional regulator [Salinibacterium hongtaonis]|uniref:IclR family transcriptional regulator n=1 Tax=Homoserinimonas hongtaonis TaxID=2079791 RepID=A0A2U1SXT9_9MICO|nr:helix-turn-helix domain-containing protein [Salinibacterium hongtaonis]AWB89004.1 IclR family transcriptional regulator [Salinibacterium hongtaonis]PWB96451.1 IclR family transcriptional regulator [Salinibacterium hongtaonis]
MRTARWTESVSVLDRLTAILDAFGDDGEGQGVSELARRANLPKSTVSRITADLVEQGLLDRIDGVLYLGIRLFELGQNVDPAQRLRRLALPAMIQLCRATGHHVHLAMPDGDDVIIIANVSGNDHRREVPRVGARLTATATALGAAIEAFTPREAGIDPDQDSDRAASRDRIRKAGVATVYHTGNDEHVCVAAPVLAHGSAVAVIAMSGMLDSLDPVRTSTPVRQTAAAVSRMVGDDS